MRPTAEDDERRDGVISRNLAAARRRRFVPAPAIGNLVDALVVVAAVVLGSLAYCRVDPAILLYGAAAVCVILVLILLLAHVLTRPLVQMTGAAQIFPHDTFPRAPIPVTGTSDSNHASVRGKGVSMTGARRGYEARVI